MQLDREVINIPKAAGCYCVSLHVATLRLNHEDVVAGAEQGRDLAAIALLQKDVVMFGAAGDRELVQRAMSQQWKSIADVVAQQSLTRGGATQAPLHGPQL